MQLTETHSEGLKRVFRVVIPASDLQSRLSDKIEEVRPKMRINGFRPGMVPASHVRRLYGASLLKEIIDGEVDSAAKEALQGGTLRVATGPNLRLESDFDKVMAGDADLTFDLDLELIPEFSPIDVSELTIERLSTPVEDQQVEDALANFAKSMRSYEEKDGAAEDGDQVVVDFVGKLDGEPFEGGSAEQAPIVIGSNQLIPGFEEQLKGATKGETRTISVTFPENYAAENLKGKAATFDITVHEVRGPKDQPIDDTLAQKYGFDTIDGLREVLRKQLEGEHAQQSRMRAKRVLFDRLDERHEFPLPAGMVEQEFQQIWREIEQAIAKGDLDEEDKSKTEDELRADYRKIAERRVKLGLVLAELGRRANIEVTNEELGQAVARQARQYPGQEQQVFEMFRNNAQLLAQLRAPIFEEKTVDYVLELVKSETKTVDRETLFADPDA